RRLVQQQDDIGVARPALRVVDLSVLQVGERPVDRRIPHLPSPFARPGRAAPPCRRESGTNDIPARDLAQINSRVEGCLLAAARLPMLDRDANRTPGLA